MSDKKCIVCGIGPREIPDRERMGRSIKLVCRACHMERLSGDARIVLKAHYDKLQRGTST